MRLQVSFKGFAANVEISAEELSVGAEWIDVVEVHLSSAIAMAMSAVKSSDEPIDEYEYTTSQPNPPNPPNLQSQYWYASRSTYLELKDDIDFRRFVAEHVPEAALLWDVPHLETYRHIDCAIEIGGITSRIRISMDNVPRSSNDRHLYLGSKLVTAMARSLGSWLGKKTIPIAEIRKESLGERKIDLEDDL